MGVSHAWSLQHEILQLELSDLMDFSLDTFILAMTQLQLDSSEDSTHNPYKEGEIDVPVLFGDHIVVTTDLAECRCIAAL